MFCPECRYEYKEGTTVCPDCGARLVSVLPPKPDPVVEPPPEPLEYEEVLTIYSPGDIGLIKGILESEGISFFFKGEHSTSQLAGSATLMVEQDRASEVSELMKDYVHTDVDEEKYDGLGGWLLLLAASLAIGLVTLTLELLLTDYYDNPLDWTIAMAGIAAYLILLYHLHRLKRRFRLLFVLFAVASTIINTVDYLVLLSAHHLAANTGYIWLTGHILFSPIYWGVLWIWYLFKSERVKQTMVN